MNIVERTPLDQLIPLATGLLPAKVALKWLINQPIATAVPGTTTVEEAEVNTFFGSLEDPTLTQSELDEVADLAEKLEHVRCRICRACEPCPVDIPIGSTLGTDAMYDHYLPSVDVDRSFTARI